MISLVPEKIEVHLDVTSATVTAPQTGEEGHDTPALLSVNVGLPRDVAWQGKTVHTGIWKEPVHGPAMVRRLNIDGDGQGDLKGHGGEQRAVLVYQIESYRHWEQHFGRDDFSYGQFGENLTVDGLADDKVCIGDRYRIGEAEFEVTQPRVTCYRVGVRLGEPEMPALLVSHHRPGFYMRVLREGHIEAGDQIIKTRTGPHALSVTDTDALLYLPGRDAAKLRRAAEIPALSPGWQQSFRELIDAAERGGPATAPPPGTEPDARPGPAWTGFRPLRVTKVARETATVSSIYLAAQDGSVLPAAQAGLYITLRVAAAGQPAPVRSYSLSSAPGAAAYRISVKSEPHGVVSRYLNRSLRPGATLEVAAPRGDFVLDDGSGPVLLISAGIGVTPVLSMLHQLAQARSEREVWWINSARRPREHPLAAEALALLQTLAHTRENLFYSQATPAELRRDHAVAGHVTKHTLAALGLPTSAQAYVCGPPAYMADVRDALSAAGIEPARVHAELFAALPSTNPGVVGRAVPAPHAPPGPPGTGPLVTFARSGVSTPFGASWHSLLDLADACDVPTRWSCRAGVCHTCITPLLSGAVSYSPDPLEPPSDGQVLICCSRPRSDVTLDM
jgi:ferredoxin-NADP reductase/MOSC domain-containing protein YiiM